MLRYKVSTKFNNKEKSLGIFNSLEDAYRCVSMNGRGTSRKFNIDIVYEAPMGRITAKDAREILEKVGEINEKKYNDKSSNLSTMCCTNSKSR